MNAYVGGKGIQLANNPILLYISVGAYQNAEYQILDASDNLKYTSKVCANETGVIIVDISDIIRSMLEGNDTGFETLSSYFESNSTILWLAPDFSDDFSELLITSVRYSLSVMAEGTTKYLGPFMAFSGGINKLQNPQSNAFYNKLNSEDFLPILTSRTVTRNITMKECEVYPLLFFIQQPITSVRRLFVNSAGKTIEFSESISGYQFDQPVALNVNAIRKEFFNQYRFFPTQMEFSMEDKYLCSLTIEENSCPKPVTLIFKNTFGVYEKKALDHKFETSSNFENSAFQRFNVNQQEFEKKYLRSSRSDVMKASITVNSMEEYIFVMDMLHSDDVWMEHQGKKQAVFVSPENIVQKNDFKPFSIALNIEPRITVPFAPLDFRVVPSVSKIFDATFDDTFA